MWKNALSWWFGPDLTNACRLFCLRMPESHFKKLTSTLGTVMQSWIFGWKPNPKIRLRSHFCTTCCTNKYHILNLLLRSLSFVNKRSTPTTTARRCGLFSLERSSHVDCPLNIGRVRIRLITKVKIQWDLPMLPITQNFLSPNAAAGEGVGRGSDTSEATSGRWFKGVNEIWGGGKNKLWGSGITFSQSIMKILSQRGT
jgi:hypothetical protein